MSIDDIVRIADAMTRLLGVLLWPALLLFALIRFGPVLKEFFSSLGELTFKGAGVEASLKRKQAEAAAALAAAAVIGPDSGSASDRTAENAKAAAELVATAVTPTVIRRASKAKLLWVDDNPENQAYERQALEALGVTFVLASSTEKALALLRSQQFDVIISDMGRPPDQRAGYTLLEAIRSSGDKTPFIIYSGSTDPKHRLEAKQRGAVGSTNRAAELFGYVLSALGRDA